MLPTRRPLLLLILSMACVPSAVDRAVLDDGGATISGEPDGGGFGGSGPPARDGSSGGGPGGGGAPGIRRDAAPDRSLPPAPGGPDAPRADRTGAPDLLENPDSQVVVDAAPEPPPPNAALLVVGDANMPTAGDTSLRTVLAARGLAVRLATDTAQPNVNGVRLVVLASSCAAADLMGKYRNVALPLINIESAVFPDLGMTGPVRSTDQGEDPAAQLNIVAAGHPLAAGLTGNLAVVNPMSAVTWGLPAATAERVAVIQGMGNRVAIFGYRRGAAMVAGQAPARRVGFFAANEAAANLTDNGVRLFAAAIDWAIAAD